MAILTLRQLIDEGACVDQRALFKATFGESVDVTEDLCVQHAQDFDWIWAAYHLLSADQQVVYNSALSQAQAAYGAALSQERAAYRAAVNQARAAYDAAVNQAGAAYDAAVDQAQAVYSAAQATTWARAYNS